MGESSKGMKCGGNIKTNKTLLEYAGIELGIIALLSCDHDSIYRKVKEMS